MSNIFIDLAPGAHHYLHTTAPTLPAGHNEFAVLDCVLPQRIVLRLCRLNQFLIMMPTMMTLVMLDYDDADDDVK